MIARGTCWEMGSQRGGCLLRAPLSCLVWIVGNPGKATQNGRGDRRRGTSLIVGVRGRRRGLWSRRIGVGRRRRVTEAACIGRHGRGSRSGLWMQA